MQQRVMSMNVSEALNRASFTVKLLLYKCLIPNVILSLRKQNLKKSSSSAITSQYSIQIKPGLLFKQW